MSKITIISPFREFTELVNEVTQDRNYRIFSPKDDLDFSLEESVEMAQAEVKKGTEVIITRGGTYNRLKKLIDIPIVEVKMNILDILRTLDSIKHKYKIIGLIGSENIICDYHEMGDYLNLQVYPIFSYEHDLDVQVRRAFTNGVEIVIGDGISVDYAKKFGLPGIKLVPAKNAVEDAIGQAENLISASYLEREKNEQFRMILESTPNGILLISSEGEIVVANSTASTLLQLDPATIHEKWKEDGLHRDLFRLLESNTREFSGEILRLGKYTLSVTRRNVRVGEDDVGLVITLQDITNIQQLEQMVRKKLHQKGFIAKSTIDDIISVSPSMKQIKEMIRSYSQADSTILIQGETGTGKELTAQSIHNLSQRKHGPFVAINCGALPASLLESELFGYEAGAFTGANRSGKEGLFELAHGGTLFLDEIGEIPIELQSRLLRVIQEKEVMRIGGSAILPIDVRIIVATHRNLREDVDNGTFRSDLFYRLNILNITLPPLRERQEDIPYLTNHLLSKICTRYHKEIPSLPDDFIFFLQTYSWKGNTRQLENTLERIVVLFGSQPLGTIIDQIQQELQMDFKPEHKKENEDFFDKIKDKTLDQVEKMVIQFQLERFKGNKELTAGFLGISRGTLWRKLKEIG